MNKTRMIRRIFAVTIPLIILDQAVKIFIQWRFEEPVGSGLLKIHSIQNTGMAFGKHPGNIRNILWTVVVLLIVMNFIRSQQDRIDTKTAAALSLILAGGSSNLLDRIFHGAVVDFIEIEHFAIFNLADCYVMLRLAAADYFSGSVWYIE